MRGGTVLPSRPVYYDRNPLATQQSYEAGAVAPHVQTTRTTYTVPTGKKAYGEYIILFLFRSAAAAPVGIANAQASYTPSGGGAANVGIIISNSNTVGATDRLVVTSFGLLAAGDVVTTSTTDSSTGGTVDYKTIQKYTQFDA